MKKTDSIQKRELIDPIGAIEVIFILSTTLQVVSTLHQFGAFSNSGRRISKQISSLEYEVYRLENSLMDIINVCKRHSKNKNILESNISLVGTVMYLKAKDYVRYMSIKDELRNIGFNIHRINKSIERGNLDILKEHKFDHFDNELLDSLDSILRSFGEMKMYDFIKLLQKNLDLLRSTIRKISF